MIHHHILHSITMPMLTLPIRLSSLILILIFMSFGSIAKETDSDGDGVFDNIDNCPTTANADQADLNNNGIGDICEESICVTGKLDFKLELIDLINNFRIDNELNPLDPDIRLNNSAQLHAQFMRDNNSILKGSASADAAAQGYESTADRTAAAGYPTPQAVFDALIADEPNRQGLLIAGWTQIGIGYTTGGTLNHWWSIDLGTSSQPPICDLNLVDLDQDGYSIVGGDCNDDEATIFPGAPEICGDGIDQDCDGVDLICIVDTDDDGIPDSEDNCPTIYNPDQLDANENGIGDICEGEVCATGRADFKLELVDLINNFRVANGVDPLDPDIRLNNSGQLHAEYMRDNGVVTKTSENGTSPSQNATAQGYDSNSIVDRTATAGYATPQAAFDALVDNEPIREGLLLTGWKHIGIGYAIGGSFGHWWSIDLGTSSEPAVCIISSQVSITSQLLLQGRPAAPDPSYSIPVTIEVFELGAADPFSSYESNTDEMGILLLEDLAIDEGNYIITIKNSHTLRNGIEATIVNGENPVEFGEIREGDANNDNAVSIVDFSLLSSAFNTVPEDANFNPNTDFNESGAVTIQDFSLLSANFGQGGFDIASYNTGRRASDHSSPRVYYGGESIFNSLNDVLFEEVSMELEYPTNPVEPGTTFTAQVVVRSGNQPFDAAEVHLDFDPDVLQVTSLGGTGELPLLLTSEFDNKAGTIDFSAGTLSNLPLGTTTVLSIEFDVIEEREYTAISFADRAPGASMITFAGNLILAGTTDGEIEIEVCADCPDGVMIYPNATDGPFSIRINQALAPEAIQISDMQGKILYQQDISDMDNLNFDLSDQPTGIYLVEIQTDQGSIMRKVLKK